MTARVSATQLKMWREQCKMLWYLSYVAGKKPPPSLDQDIGSRIHKCLEDYITHGVFPDTKTEEGLIASSALHLIPMERAIQSETHFDDLPIQPSSPMPLTGIIDVLCLDGVPLVMDFKTTASKRWMKKSYELSSDIQLMLYAYLALTNAPLQSECDIALCYIGKKERWAQVVQTRVTRDQVVAFFEQALVPAMQEMEIAGFCEPEEMQRNYDFCSAYGGCALRDVCEHAGSPC